MERSHPDATAEAIPRRQRDRSNAGQHIGTCSCGSSQEWRLCRQWILPPGVGTPVRGRDHLGPVCPRRAARIYTGIEVLNGDFCRLDLGGNVFCRGSWVYIDSRQWSNRWTNVRRAGDPGGARSFMAAHGASALTALAFVMALVIRIQWPSCRPSRPPPWIPGVDSWI